MWLKELQCEPQRRSPLLCPLLSSLQAARMSSARAAHAPAPLGSGSAPVVASNDNSGNLMAGAEVGLAADCIEPLPSPATGKMRPTSGIANQSTILRPGLGCSTRSPTPRTNQPPPRDHTTTLWPTGPVWVGGRR